MANQNTDKILLAQKAVVDVAIKLKDIELVEGSGVCQDVCMVLPPAQSATWGSNDQTEDILLPDCCGELQRAFQYTRQRETTLNIEYGARFAQLVALAQKQALVEKTNQLLPYFCNWLDLSETGSTVAAPVGTYGNGLAANAPLVGAYMDAFGLSKPLTQDAATEGFTVGADGLITVTADVQDCRVAFCDGSYTVAQMATLGPAVALVDVSVRVVDLAKNVWIITFEDAQPQAQDVNFGQVSQTLSFNVGGAVNLYVPNQINKC